MKTNAMTIDEAMELAARIADPEDGCVEEMMEFGADVCGVIRDEVLKSRDDLARETAERDELRAIVEGRATPPTAAEIVALQRVGGSCTVSVFYGDGSCRVLWSTREGVALMLREAEYVTSRGWSVAWRAFDAEGRPCAWPKVTP